jgi:hypothetical protein
MYQLELPTKLEEAFMFSELVYNVSVFGDFSSIIPTPESVIKMTQSLSKYNMIPTTFQEIQITPLPGVISSPQDRLQMLSKDNQLTVIFGANRIDINRNAETEGGFDKNKMNDYNKIAMDILELCVDDKIRYDRIALNTISILSELTRQQSEVLLKKIQPSIDYYSSINEITLRVNKQNTLKIANNSNELINFILNFQRVSGQMVFGNKAIPLENDFVVSFDLNTNPINKTQRFSSNDVLTFLELVCTDRHKVINELMPDDKIGE